VFLCICVWFNVESNSQLVNLQKLIYTDFENELMELKPGPRTVRFSQVHIIVEYVAVLDIVRYFRMLSRTGAWKGFFTTIWFDILFKIIY